MEWNSTKSPKCVVYTAYYSFLDIEDPYFTSASCTGTVIYLDRYDSVAMTRPEVLDSTGLTPSLTPDLPVNSLLERNTNFTWTSMDHSGNTAICLVQVKIKGNNVDILWNISKLT